MVNRIKTTLYHPIRICLSHRLRVRTSRVLTWSKLSERLVDKMTEVSLKWPCHGHKHWLQNDTNGYEMLRLVVFTFIKYSKGPTRIYEKITSYQ